MRSATSNGKYYILILCICLLAHCQKRDKAVSKQDGIEFDSGSGPVLVRILDAQNDAPLAGATIAIGTGANTAEPHNMVANADGYAIFPDIIAGPQLVRIRHPGYEPGFARVQVAPRSTKLHSIRLMPARTRQIAEPAVAVKIKEEKYEIEIPGNAFTGPADQPVRLRYTMAEPTTTGIRAMPGSFRGIPADSSKAPAGAADLENRAVPLESFGAIAISAFRGEREVNLTPGKKIRVRFACEEACAGGKPPGTVPLWSLDEATGLWKEEGVGRIVREGATYMVEAELPHLSWWNIDRPLREKSAIVVRGFVDERGKSLGDASILGEGLDRLMRVHGRYAWPDSKHNEMCIEVPPNTRIRLKALAWRGSLPYEGEMVLKTGAPGRDCRANRRGVLVLNELKLQRSPQAEHISQAVADALRLGYSRLEQLNLRDGSVLFGSITDQQGRFYYFQSLQGRLRLPINSVKSIIYR